MEVDSSSVDVAVGRGVLLSSPGSKIIWRVILVSRPRNFLAVISKTLGLLVPKVKLFCQVLSGSIKTDSELMKSLSPFVKVPVMMISSELVVTTSSGG